MKLLPILVGTAATCALIAVVSFVLYTRARMKEDPNEEFYQRVHYTSLFLLFAIGIIIMFYYGAYSD